MGPQNAQKKQHLVQHNHGQGRHSVHDNANANANAGNGDTHDGRMMPRQNSFRSQDSGSIVHRTKDGDGDDGDSDSNHSSGSLDRSSNSDSGTTISNRTDLQQELARNETRHVCWLRGTVILVLALATVFVSVTMFYSIRQSELETYQVQFADHASSIISAFETHVKEGIASLDHLGMSIVSQTRDYRPWQTTANASLGAQPEPAGQWPFVTVPEWHFRAASTRTLGFFSLLSFVPVVPNGPNTRSDSDNPQSTRVIYEQWTDSSTEPDTVGENESWIQLGIAYERQVNQTDWNFGNFQSVDNINNRRRRRRRLQSIPDDGIFNGNQVNQPPAPQFDIDTGVPSNIYRLDNTGLTDTATATSIRNNAIVREYLPSDADFDVDTNLLFPIWQHSPVTPELVNFDLATHSQFGPEIELALDTNQVILGQPTLNNNALFVQNGDSQDTDDTIYVPSSIFAFPLTRDASDPSASASRIPLGVLIASIYWDSYLQVGELPSTANDMQIVLSNDCGPTFTFQVQDETVLFLSVGDTHETNDFTDELMTQYSIQYDFFANNPLLTFSPAITVNEEYCPYTLTIYPAIAMQKRYETNQPVIFTALVCLVFCFTTLVFVGYDYYVERRQKIVLNTAVKSHAIVSSLFPKTVRERLLGDEAVDRDGNIDNNELNENLLMLTTQKAKLKSFMRDTGRSASTDIGSNIGGGGSTAGGSTNGEPLKKSKPIADLFPHTTVLFADIAGFTAWSSTREPSQVFTLLETLYGAFDRIAEKRRVFKVETIGDCYVAATGLPDPQPDHALIMVKFAGDILQKMERITRDLEVELGPDTGDLALRIGLHSGPVTAGVLRGQKSRFQLFGDTVNTASRMESNGRPNHIQCSQSTADLLTAVKPNWVVPRQDKIHAKGKGLVQTYWVFARGRTVVSGGATASISGSVDDMTLDDMSNDGSHASLGSNNFKQIGIVIPDNLYLEPKRSANFERLVDWNVDLLLRLLKAVVARQHCMKERKTHGIARVINPVYLAKDTVHLAAATVNATANIAAHTVSGVAGMIKPQAGQNGVDPLASSMGKEFDLNNPRDEYVECIHLPRFDKNTSVAQVTADDITLKPHIEEQLRDYVTKIACSYHDNPFHNYDHASHVTMSANKILKRIVEAADCEVQPTSLAGVAETLHEYSYGITSDPLTHFACVFSAMIHDVDHPGVSNAQLIKEFDDMAALYENKSVAEQNSVDLAWGLLMDTAYTDLRRVLFANDEEKRRFRQLLVNSVMATDIFDPELKQVRNKRWERAFSETHDNLQEGSDLKATIVIEHIIQAADVSHTMQHWHVYQKWNRRLFNEMYRAYRSGRLEKDPSEGWYKGELWFYDNYIIPLAKKLKDCGVFGVSSDEFLNYAMMNRSEWESKGESIVAELKTRAEERYGKKSSDNKNEAAQSGDLTAHSKDDSLGSLTDA